MKVREKSIELCVLECICHSALLFAIITLIWLLFAEEDCMNLFMLLTVIASEMGMYHLRRYIHKSWLFVGTLLLYLGIFWIIAGIFGTEYFFAAVVIAIHSAITGFIKKYDVEKPSALLAGIMVFTGICIWLANSQKLLLVYYVCEAIYIMALLIYRNIVKADEFIWENRRTSFLYVSQIKNANYLVTILVSAITLVVTALCALIFTPLLNYLRHPLMNILRWITSMPDMPDMPDFMKPVEPDPIEGVYGPSEGGTVPVVLNILFGLMSLAGVALVVAFVIKIIKMLSLSTREGDIKEYIIPAHKENAQKVNKAEEKEVFDERPSRKIRKIYKKTIKSRIKKDNKIPKASTPMEQKALAKLEGSGAEDFIGLYYKARYSNKECTEEDVERMKEYK